MVCIFWKTATQKLHTISDLAGIFPTESEAVAFSLQAGKDWIDSQPAAAKDLNKSEFVQFTDNEPAINDLMFRYHPTQRKARDQKSPRHKLIADKRRLRMAANGLFAHHHSSPRGQTAK